MTEAARDSMMRCYLLGPWRRFLSQPAFLVCLILLVVCAGGLEVMATKMKLHFRKLPIPLKLPLDQMADENLAPYEVHQKFDIPEDIESELGTKDYIQWLIRDTSRRENDPLSVLVLFVTYYTGNPDKVPHVPDVCYVGGGGNVGRKENILLELPEILGESDGLPFRVLNIEVPSQLGQTERVVGYFFAVNGTYRNQRNDVRLLQNNVRDKYAYFCKVELYFPLAADQPREEVIEGMQAFLRRLMPTLLEDHLPVANEEQWKRLNSENEATQSD